ncbi:MAG: phage baseplate assembly protein V [Oculatellaceae cyanobacterium bins.114]|nr:phage baseplate assembly protein V [Oculatellaceae cyanobacterium bins.114]
MRHLDMDEMFSDSATDQIEKFYGKYRGTVVNNIDPKRIGRLQVIVPDISMTVMSWAMPCVPWAGLQMGMYVVPPIGAGVWIEFEQGDPDYPIWVGCWWGETPELPSIGSTSTTPGTPVVVIQTATQSAVVVSDVAIPPMKAPGVMLMSSVSSITVDATGITITAPKITLKGAAIDVQGITDINNGALKVT